MDWRAGAGRGVKSYKHSVAKLIRMVCHVLSQPYLSGKTKQAIQLSWLSLKHFISLHNF